SAISRKHPEPGRLLRSSGCAVVMCDDGRLVFRFRFEVPGDLLMQGLLAASREPFIRRFLHERMVEAVASLAVVSRLENHTGFAQSRERRQQVALFCSG